jgi:SAM-dependent methyltransferase
MEKKSASQGRAGLSQRLFAWFYSRDESPEYDQVVGEYKKKLFADLQGDVLEIGPGTGANFPYFPPRIHWIGIEPNLYMHPYLLKEAERYNFQVDIRAQTVEHLDLPDNSVDAVVSTLVMCSVTDPQHTLQEILRVLKPRGKFIFIEHVAAAEQTRTRRLQNFLQPVWKLLADGCNPNRETARFIDQAGFRQVEIENFQAPIAIATPHIAGFAVK